MKGSQNARLRYITHYHGILQLALYQELSVEKGIMQVFMTQAYKITIEIVIIIISIINYSLHVMYTCSAFRQT